LTTIVSEIFVSVPSDDVVNNLMTVVHGTASLKLLNQGFAGKFTLGRPKNRKARCFRYPNRL